MFGIFEGGGEMFLKLNSRILESLKLNRHLSSKLQSIKDYSSNFIPPTFAKQRQALLTSKTSVAGFTLVELLVVIAIVAILAAVSLVVYSQISVRSRDGVRIADLDNLKNAIQLSTHDDTNQAQALCFGLSTPCQEATFPIGANTKKTNGAGWVKVNFDGKNLADFPQLPVDPKNNAQYNYSYHSDGTSWEIDAVLESTDYKNLMLNDGGNDDNKYEVGTGIKTL